MINISGMPIVQIRTLLKDMNKKYEAMTEEQRLSDEGVELCKKIASYSKKLRSIKLASKTIF